MSTAVAEKKEKPAAPMGSFLAKLSPPKEKKADEPAKNEATATSGNATAEAVVKTEPVAEASDSPKEPSKSEPEPVEKPEVAQLEKRLKDTQTWGNEEHKARLKAEREAKEWKERLERIEKKIDGTYEPTPDPSPQQLAYDAEMRGKIRASHRAAVRKYGEDHVMSQVWMPDSPYQKLQEANPLVAKRVMDSDDPVQEALDIIKEDEDARKYGRTSEEWKKAIEEELKPKLTEAILKGLKSQPGKETATLGNVRGESDRTALKPDAPAKLDLGKVFPHGASRR